MITEADARTLELGTTVVLVSGGHITPLAQDTLRARRVAVVSEHAVDGAGSLAPRAVRIVAIAGVVVETAMRAARHIRRLAKIRALESGPRT